VEVYPRFQAVICGRHFGISIMNYLLRTVGIVTIFVLGGWVAHAQPANDNFANALVLSGAVVSTNGSSVGASKEAGEPNHAANTGARSVWFNWTAPASGQVRLDTIGSSGSFNNDTLLAVYTGDTVNALTEVASNNNGPGLANGWSLLEFQASQGVTYHIAIDSFVFFPGFTPAGGPYVLNLRTLATISITAPVNNAVFQAGTPIEVDLGGEVPTPPIVRVDFYRRGVFFASDDTPPFSAIASNAPPGSNSFQAIVLDSGGISWTSAVVNVAVESVGVTILSPMDGTTFLNTNPITVSAVGMLPSGSITSVEFFVDGHKFGEDASAPFSATWSAVTGGTHRFSAIGHDDSGNTYNSVSVNIGVSQLLFPKGSVWKYLDNGSDQGSNWVTTSFDDGLWASGPAELGYGDGDEATVVNGGPTNNFFVTTYFRRSFAASNVASFTNVLINVKRDDGAVVYVNGVEAARYNMNPGPVNFSTLAINADDDGANFWPAVFPANLLVEGQNVVAVEIHQVNRTSTDISFDMDFSGIPTIIFNQPPQVALINPTNNAVFIEPPSLALEATASDADGSVVKVEFFTGNTKIGEVTNSPYTFTWNSPPLGLHPLRAVATDDQGAVQPSDTVTVTLYDQAHTPFAQITKPSNGTVIEGPTNYTVTAYASAIEGVTNVVFLANGSVIGTDDSSPYSILWTAPFGSNALQAVAFGANGLRGTSVVSSIIITIPPTNTVAPFIVSQTPKAFASVTNVLTNVVVRFSERVFNVDAADMLVNGYPATGVSGSGSNYVFTFPQPPYGEVNISWATPHGIVDFGYPENLPFDEFGPNARWEYDLVDKIAPTIAARSPVAGAFLTNLTLINVTFSELVSGVDASDLLVNGTPAFGMSGSGSNYTFNVSQPASGTVTVRWATSPGIVDLAEFPNAFNATAASAVWNFTLDSRSVLVQSNANWQLLKGISEATTPVTRWRELDYDADAWTVAPAPFFLTDFLKKTLFNSKIKLVNTNK
jgi:hypothetical protein